MANAILAVLPDQPEEKADILQLVDLAIQWNPCNYLYVIKTIYGCDRVGF